MAKSNLSSRRDLLKHSLQLGAVLAPTILRAADKSGSRMPVVGAGEFTYEVQHDWGVLPNHIRYGNTHGVVEDAQGRIYICHTVHKSSQSDHTVLVFDDQGKFIKSWGGEFRGGAHGLHIHKEGNQEFLYLTDTGKGRPGGGIDPQYANVVKMTLDGEEVLHIGYPGESDKYEVDASGKPSTKYSPTNIAIAPNGDIYVGDGYGSYRVSQYDKKGGFIRTFGEHGKEPGQMWRPHGIRVDLRGAEPELLVADRTNNRLQYFSMEGKYLRSVQGVNRPCHFHEHAGVLLIPDLAARVTLLDRNNNVIVHLGEDSTGDYEERRKKPRQDFIPGKFICPHGAWFNHRGDIFVTEWVEIRRVTKLRKVA